MFSKAASWSVICIVMVLTFFTVFGTHGLLRLEQVSGEYRTLSKQNTALESEIAALRVELFALQSSAFALEKHAREDLGLSKPGEIVYIFPHSGHPHSPPLAAPR